ncbi:MAG: carboxypeptidase-like regulatory domain-containing protein [Saprospiraceae bacterium]|nr:carboxypeptidase-like regulatory domain-containing protein [Saprospiraceae bacterium]MBP9194513.1 carboxypeptidase-like regulatory domain-containing protein [Saprospiraceae bacterium]
MFRFPALIFFLFLSTIVVSQATLFGVVRDGSSQLPIEFAEVFTEGGKFQTTSDSLGNFLLDLPENEGFIVKFYRLGYQAVEYKVPAMSLGTKRYLTVILQPQSSDLDITITASRIEDAGVVRESVSEFKILPTASGNFEAVLPSIALGVNSGSGGELSSQYNVRGGNYDENMVYINDFEVFRPQLIRAGQQEGLSFPNIDLIRDITFSSGGYEARYGNKMSSVLDIRYKRPDTFKSSVSASLLGASAHLEGSKRLGPNAYHKLRYLVGARYKTNKYLLGSLDVKGEYLPDFADVQAYLTYQLNQNLQLGFLANYNAAIFNFIPATRSTTLGLITNTLRFSTAYEGAEKDKFIHGLAGLSLNFVPETRDRPYFIKWMASRYSSSEQENFDILGYYRLAQIESNLGADNFGEEVAVLGTGTQHRFARNYLYTEIYNTELRAGFDLGEKGNSHYLEAGVKYQHESYDDDLNEWERIDSAGYSLPYSGSSIVLSQYLKTANRLRNEKVEMYVHNSHERNVGQGTFKLNSGVRVSHLDLGDEWLVSPRVSLHWRPAHNPRNLSWKLAWGIYHQAAQYREFRNPVGELNTALKAQRAQHFVAGLDLDFPWSRISKKPFRLIAEMYYKKFDRLVSYDVDNVRIAYSGTNNASGYAAGIDLRVNGEFVPDAESWINLSFLTAREKLEGVTHLRFQDTSAVAVSTVPRPTDRLASVNIFFQDYLPSNKNFKANISYSFATGLPFGTKDDNLVYRNVFRYKIYQRLDIGFSLLLWDEKKRKEKPHHFLSFSKASWLSLEVFNIMGVVNTASVTWIKTITNAQYAINNNLTSRRVNLRFRIDF